MEPRVDTARRRFLKVGAATAALATPRKTCAISGPLGSTMATRSLRTLSWACLAFNGLQTVMTAYFVTYLTTIGYTPFFVGLAALDVLGAVVLWTVVREQRPETVSAVA